MTKSETNRLLFGISDFPCLIWAVTTSQPASMKSRALPTRFLLVLTLKELSFTLVGSRQVCEMLMRRISHNDREIQDLLYCIDTLHPLARLLPGTVLL